MNMEERKTRHGYPSVDKPWLKYYKPEHIGEQLPHCTLYELFINENRHHHDDVAILFLGKQISYGEMNCHIDQCTKALLAMGATHDDIVTIAMPSTPEAAYIFYAVNRIGAVANMIHPLTSREEIISQLNEVKSRFFFMFTPTYNILRGTIADTSVETSVVVLPVQSMSPVIRMAYSIQNRRRGIKSDKHFITWKAFIAGGNTITTPLPTAERAHDDWAVISYTGGTTGKPKGVVCTNNNIIAQMRQITEGRGVKRQDVMMIQLPPFINYSLVTIIESFSYGFKTLLIPHYRPEKLVHYIHKNKVTFTHSIPAYWEPLLHIKVKPNHLASLRAIASGGEGMNTHTEKEINKKLRSGGANIQLMKGMGMTESTSGVVGTYPNCNIEGSIGIPFIMTNCKITDTSTGQELTYNQTGEICFAGPTIMWGYYGNPEATDQIIETDSQGTRWLHTGDIGYMNNDGIIFLTGRMKRLIMQRDNQCMVKKISPERIEEAISQHPAVAACCVVGIPDTARIARPVAVVELLENQTSTPHLREEITQLCATTLPSYMVPTEIIITPAMPRTDRGKIDYRAVEQMVSRE